MSIVIIRQDDKIETWKKALQEADPQLKVYSFLEDHPKEAIQMALVWKHPNGSLNQYPNLKCIASSGAGVDFIMEDESLPTDIPVTRVIDPILASDMSEHVLALIFAHLKNLNAYQRDQSNEVWAPQAYKRINELKIGILGLGALGNVLANDLVGFGFEVRGWSQSKKSIAKVTTYAGQEELFAFLAQTEILICLLPLTDQTKGILNATLFSQLPQGAYVINVARGGHLVDADLLAMLASGHLSGASLDVFHQEPLAISHPFWKQPKIHMTPHCASVSLAASVVPQILDNYKRLCNNSSLVNVVSREKGY